MTKFQNQAKKHMNYSLDGLCCNCLFPMPGFPQLGKEVQLDI